MYRVFVLFKYTNLISARGVYCNFMVQVIQGN